MWLSDKTHDNPKVFRFKNVSVNMTTDEITLATQCLSEYNCIMLSDGASAEERKGLLDLIRKFRKLQEEL